MVTDPKFYICMCWNFSYESFVNTKVLHFSWLTSDMNVEAVTYNHAIINAILIDNPGT